MFKKSLLLLLVFMSFLLCACSEPNPYSLSLAADGGDSKTCIFYDDERMVFEVGGIMMAEIDGESLMLETALNDGKITLSDILTSAQTDVDNEDITATTYPDGSVEYHYSSFNLISLNDQGIRDIYFIPTDLSYYSIVS